MTSTEDIQRALSTAGITAPARWLETVGSTNAEAASWAEAGAEEFSLVAAGHQTEGRGRQGRSWEDVAGRALMFSFVLRPKLEEVGSLPLLAGVAAAGAAREVAGADVRCKWPNDLMLGEQKVGGILSESSVEGARLKHVVIGVGINLEAPRIPGAAGLGIDVDPVLLLGAFMRRFAKDYDEHDALLVRDLWRAASATLGREVQAHRVDGDIVRGLAVDVDEEGGLVIDSAEGRITIRSGEVEHLL